MAAEKNLQTKSLKLINGLQNAKAINIKANGTENGTPDIIASIKGMMIVFEVKNPDKPKEKELQRYRILQWLESKAKVFYLNKYSDVVSAINDLKLIPQYEKEMPVLFMSSDLSMGKLQTVLSEKNITVLKYFDSTGW